MFFRLALLSGLVFIFALILLFGLLAWAYQDKIKEAFVHHLNQGLKTEIFVEDISINILRSFPLASLTLTNATVMGSAQPADTLLAARKIYFQFSIVDFLRQNYTVRQVEISRALLHMKLLEDTNNFSFWESEPTHDASPKDFNFHLQRVLLNDVEYRLQDLRNQHEVSLLVKKLGLRGDFTRDSYVMEIQGDVYLDKLVLDNAFMAGQQNVSLDFGLDVLNNELFRFRQGRLSVGSHDFLVQGSMDFSEPDAWLDLEIGAQKLKLENFIRDLPPAYARYFEGYRSRGDFYFQAMIKGTFSSLVKPYVSADFGIKQGELFHRRANLRFEDISFDASFNNGNRRNLSTSALSVSDFKASLNNAHLKGEGRFFNFEEPLLDFKLFSDISAGEWVRFLQIDTIPHASGQLLVDVSFKGRLGKNRSFTTREFMASSVDGGIKVENLSLRIKNDPLDYNSIRADFLFNNNDVVVKHFSGKASGSDFYMQGFFRNMLPWLFTDNERIVVDASLKSSNINFNELLQHQSGEESDTTYRLRLSDKIDFHLKADIEQLAFRKFQASNVKGTLTMRDQVFLAENITLATMKGRILANGFINGKNENTLIMGCDARLENVDVNQLFYQMGNFGQQGIVDDNLRGRITANASFVSHWNPQLEIDWSSLETTANIKVENGELINYKPMMALSRFIRVGDLNRVEFSTLENQIRIKDQKIIIPDMEINSNAINIKLSGEHNFNNEIDYRLQVLLSDLLARRNRESRNPQEQYGDIIDDGLGRTTLFLLVTGTTDDPVFRYDRQGVREKLREDFRQERHNLRDLLQKEFGIARSSDTLPDGTVMQPTERKTQQQEIKKREQGRFVIEWDED